MISIALVVVVAVVVLAVVLALSGSRGAGVAIGVCALVVAGGAAMFLLRAPAPRLASVPAAPVAVAVAPPAPTGLDVPPADAPSRAVRGRVLKGAEGAIPFEGAAVKAVLVTAGPADRAAGLSSCTADADGRFTLEGLPEGAALRVQASSPGFAAPVATIAADAEDEVVLRLVPGARVSGKVLERESRIPVAGALVSWEEASSALSAPDGSFSLEPVPAGDAHLTARAKGYARRSITEKVPAEGLSGLEILLRPGASVSGTVLDPEGKPRAGATLRVEVLAKLPFVGDSPIPFAIDETVSGADGTYRIDGLPVGRKLRLDASTPDLLGEPADAGPLEKGIEEEGVDIHLRRGGAVLATVLDQDGKPLAGAAVTAVPAAGEDGGVAVAMVTMQVRRGGSGARTDATGQVRVEPVEPGPVKVRATLQDYRSAETPLVAGSGAETPVTLTLDAGKSLSGRVVDAQGAALPDASVTVQRFGMGSMIHETRTTGADGTFRVGGLDGKGFMLQAGKKGYVDASLAGLEPGDTEVVVTLPLGGALVGTVLDPDGRPVPKFRIVARRKGEGAPSPTDWRRMMAANLGTQFEDAGGRFRLDGLEPGTYSVEGRADGFAPGTAEGLAVEAGTETGVEVRMEAGLTLTGIVVRKLDGTPVAGARVKVPGEGVFGDMDFDLGGDMDPALDDMDLGGAADVQGMMGGLSKSNQETGPDGRFALRGLEPGTVRLTISARGFAPGSARGITLPATQEVRVELGEEGAVEGIVTDAAGAPKEGAMVMLQRLPTFMRMARTDGKGHYRVGGLGAGTYLFYVMENPAAAAGGNFNMKSESVRVEEGKTARKDHRVGEGTKVTGRVTRSGKPVSGVMVMLFPSTRSGGNLGTLMGGGGGGFAMGSTKEDGTFEIAGVNPGRYTVTVQTGFGGSPAGSEPLEVRAGVPEVRHDVVLPDTGIRGIVVDEQGKPVSGATVMAAVGGADLSKLTDMGAAMESIGGQAFTDDEGRFSLTGMRPGAWSLRVQAQGFGTETVEGVQAVEGGAGDVRVVLRAGLEVVVRVVDPDGKPVRGAGVFVNDEAGREISNISQFDAVKTGEDGRVTVRVPAGSLRFDAAAAGYAPGSTAAAVPAAGEVTVRLARGATLKVTVRSAAGAPVGGAGVELLDAEGKPFGRHFSMEAFAELLEGASTAPDGTLVRKDLPPGAWKVRAATPDGLGAEASVVLEEGRTAEVALTLR